MIENVKYKVADVAKDLKQPVKDVIDVLGEKFPQKKAQTALTEEELNFVFEHYTKKNEVTSFAPYFATAGQPKPEKKKEEPKAEAPKAAEKPAEKPAPAPKAEEKPAAPVSNASSSLFEGDMLAQLNAVFARMGSKLVLKVALDDRPVSAELKQYMEELARLTDKLSVEMISGDDHAPFVKVCRPDGSETGLAFHGVPGGHEFTSFVLGLYNAAGPGQPLDADVRTAIAALPQRKMQVLVSLSCTMCPELVTAAQRIAAENAGVSAEVYDLTHFPDLRDKYNVMSVPCLVIDEGRTVTFGKKNIRQLLDILKE